MSVCCMCGDVGFPDKLFRCNKCRNRFQHSYCSNYYSEYAEPIELCDWCRSEETSTTRHGGGSSSKKLAASASRSEYSGDKIKKHDQHTPRDEEMGGSGEKAAAGKNHSSPVPSPRTATRSDDQVVNNSKHDDLHPIDVPSFLRSTLPFLSKQSLR